MLYHCPFQLFLFSGQIFVSPAPGPTKTTKYQKSKLYIKNILLLSVIWQRYFTVKICLGKHTNGLFQSVCVYLHFFDALFQVLKLTGEKDEIERLCL